jgi:hypothetical protein
MSVNKLASDMYTGAADFGKVYAMIVSIAIFIISIIAIFIGSYFIRKKSVYSKQVSFEVISSTVRTNTYTDLEKNSRTVTVYDLLGKVKDCENKIYSLVGYSSSPSAGSVISAWIKPDCMSTDAIASEDSTKVMGWIIVAIGSLFIIGNALRLFFVRKFKGVAAIQGAAGAGNIFKALF